MAALIRCVGRIVATRRGETRALAAAPAQQLTVNEPVYCGVTRPCTLIWPVH